jgi:hypothetical protein
LAIGCDPRSLLQDIKFPGDFEPVTTAGFMADITTKEDHAGNEQRAAQANRKFEARKAAGFGDSPLNRNVRYYVSEIA